MATKIKITPDQRTITQLEDRLGEAQRAIVDLDRELTAARQLIEKLEKEATSNKSSLKWAEEARDKAVATISQINGFLDAVPAGPPRKVPRDSYGEMDLDTSSRLMVYLASKIGG
jgi:chromosome segregation ATPase